MHLSQGAENAQMCCIIGYFIDNITQVPNVFYKELQTSILSKEKILYGFHYANSNTFSY